MSRDLTGRALAECEKASPDGPGRGARRAAMLKSRPRLSACRDGGRPTAITAGTAMPRSKLPLMTAGFGPPIAWRISLRIAWRRIPHSNGKSARQLEDQLEDQLEGQRVASKTACNAACKTAWLLLSQKVREPRQGVVEGDQTEIPCREGDAFRDRGNASKIRGIGAGEGSDRDTNPSKRVIADCGLLSHTKITMIIASGNVETNAFMFHVGIPLVTPGTTAGHSGQGFAKVHTFLNQIQGIELLNPTGRFDILLGMDILSNCSLKIEFDRHFSLCWSTRNQLILSRGFRVFVSTAFSRHFLRCIFVHRHYGWLLALPHP
jgi:hypothetical protein